MPPKVRDGETTRATILATARSQFGEHGFERTTIRSIAAAAGVDPALVMHYFGSKAELFAAASRFDITFPDLSDVAPDRIADVLLPLFVSVWGPEGPFLPLLRAAATNKAAAAAMLEVFVDRVAPALAAAVPDRAAERAALVGAQVLGLATARYILCIPALAEMDDAQLIEWLRPVLAHYLTGSALTGSTPA
ncbi:MULTISPECIES: TetR/AcrR family transcriptional regulator [Mycobacterium]|uniref:TetR family transcriptional regulator n=1 Tax=Mycobacterium gordonae TaxID=1778 RepID=A0A1X1W4Z4_MYCGO|nr:MULTISPECIES: TetR/AcrR family transcriptional regulator [Mycobacterium]MBX9978230.1 TetR family transcriptional regulator [Mycobacterium gordonae]MCQ4362093.1 TetR family transcriptional regulator [Mycobacterium gordonae]MCV7006219.1 TetR family transcriptional regulator [Mycobacterium gordonae]ODR18442.1 TetR family transcriptional regulator [Mycobacterium gordonae]ORV81590.1 TetR family transcriptional regulator [Mycobacterium gordonae]